MLGLTELNRVRPASHPTLGRLLKSAWSVAWIASAAFGCSRAGDESSEHDSASSRTARMQETAPLPDAQQGAAGSAATDAAGAMADAYAALVAADYDALPELITRLEADFEHDPQQGRVAFYAGVMHLWHMTAGDLGLGERFKEVTQSIKLLERASALRPEDPHAHAFLGIAQVAFGNTTEDEERLAKGRQILDESVRLYPAYVHGVRAQALGMTPKDHPFFADAPAAVRASFAACGVSESDLEALAIDYPAQQKQGTCWNGGIVAHVWEGNSLIAGDIFVKAGDVEAARRLYENAKSSPTYDRWPFQHELERRIAEADARAALYSDAVPDNDPPTWMQERNLCVGCHADDR